MKNSFILLVLLAFLVPIIAGAQPTTRKIYADSLYYSATPTNATNAAWGVLGYGKSINLRNDIGTYKDKFLCVKFTKITDSIAVYGGRVNFGTDTTWEQLFLPVLTLTRLAGISTASGSKVVRDTLVQWLSPVTTDQMTFTIDMSRFIFPAYKVRLGTYDTGKAYLQDIRRGGY